jgi:hypothetical protein
MSFSFQSNPQTSHQAKAQEAAEQMNGGYERQSKKFATPAIPKSIQKKLVNQDPVSLSVEEARIKMSQERRMVAVMSDEVNQWIQSLEGAHQGLCQYEQHLQEVALELDRMIHFFPLRAVIAQDVQQHFQAMASLLTETRIEEANILAGQPLPFPSCAKVLHDTTTDLADTYIAGMVSPIEKAVNRFVNGYNQTLKMDFRLETLKLVAGPVALMDIKALTQTEPLAALIEQVNRAKTRVAAAVKHFANLLDEVKTTVKPYQQDFRLKEHIRSDSQASSQLNVIQDAVQHREVKGLLFHTTRLTQLTRQLLSL